MKFVANIDLLLNQLQNAVIHVLAADPGTPAEGQFYYNSTSKVLKFYTGTVWITLGRLDQVSVPTASVSLGGQLITNLGTPVSTTDAATKAYVDGLAGSGVAWKGPVRAATTAAGTLATSFENADVIDGVTLATGDRILIKDQAAGAENGIYTVNASGAPTRATDADSAADLSGAAAFVQEGTVNADSAWVMTNDGVVVVGTTALVFVQFSGLGQVTAGAGLTKTGTTLNIGAGTGITVNADDVALTVPVAIVNGGTGGITAAAARTSLGVPSKFSVDCDAAVTTVVTHSLNTRDVIVSVVRTTTPWDEVLADVESTSVNTVTVRFAVAPTAAQYRINVIG